MKLDELRAVLEGIGRLEKKLRDKKPEFGDPLAVEYNDLVSRASQVILSGLDLMGREKTLPNSDRDVVDYFKEQLICKLKDVCSPTAYKKIADVIEDIYRDVRASI